MNNFNNMKIKDIVSLLESGALSEGKFNTLFDMAKKTKAGQAIGTAIGVAKKNPGAVAGLVGGGIIGNKIGNNIGDRIRLRKAGGKDGKIRNPLVDCLSVGEKGTNGYNRCVKAAYAKKGSGNFKKKVDSIESSVRSAIKK